MDSFDNFQYESASSYGGMGIVDDTSSIYTSNTQQSVSNLDAHDNDTTLDLEGLSITDDRSSVAGNGNGHVHAHSTGVATLGRIGAEEDFDAVLDDLKDGGQVDLPPHACRFVLPLRAPIVFFDGSDVFFCCVAPSIAPYVEASVTSGCQLLRSFYRSYARGVEPSIVLSTVLSTRPNLYSLLAVGGRATSCGATIYC